MENDFTINEGRDAPGALYQFLSWFFGTTIAPYSADKAKTWWDNATNSVTKLSRVAQQFQAISDPTKAAKAVAALNTLAEKDQRIIFELIGGDTVEKVQEFAMAHPKNGEVVFGLICDNPEIAKTLQTKDSEKFNSMMRDLIGNDLEKMKKLAGKNKELAFSLLCSDKEFAKNLQTAGKDAFNEMMVGLIDSDQTRFDKFKTANEGLVPSLVQSNPLAMSKFVAKTGNKGLDKKIEHLRTHRESYNAASERVNDHFHLIKERTAQLIDYKKTLDVINGRIADLQKMEKKKRPKTYKSELRILKEEKKKVLREFRTKVKHTKSWASRLDPLGVFGDHKSADLKRALETNQGKVCLLSGGFVLNGKGELVEAESIDKTPDGVSVGVDIHTKDWHRRFGTYRKGNSTEKQLEGKLKRAEQTSKKIAEGIAVLSAIKEKSGAVALSTVRGSKADSKTI